ncbi:MAG: GAF domain-containing protein, partial [Anaerolineae bacterium]|nr:GAF domain-containing protein [Anaerolineae bacterium]
LAGKVNSDPLYSIFEDVQGLGQTGEIYLVGIDKIALSNTRNSDQRANLIVATKGVETVLLNRSEVEGTFLNYNGDQVFGLYRWLPQLKSVLVVEQSQAEANQEIRTTLILNGSVALLTMAIAIITAAYINQSIATPLTDLAKKSSEFTAGNFNIIEPIDREDEIGALSAALFTMTSQLRESLMGLEKMVEERTVELEKRNRFLRAASDIGKTATQNQKLSELLGTISHMVSDKFGFYHVGIYLVDQTKEYAELKSANSEGGWRMLARGHKLRIGEQGVVGHVTSIGEYRIQQKVSEGGIYFDNPDLPHTRSELALPLMIGREILGALDIHSVDENAFLPDDVDALLVLADQVAMAVYNTKLLSQLEERLEIERRTFGNISREGWASLLRKNITGFRSTPKGIATAEDDPRSLSHQAISQRKMIKGGLSPDGERYPLAIPIIVTGGEVVAALETYKLAEDGDWTNSELEFLKSLIEQIAITLENARLFEETQRLAQRESIVADVSGKVWSSQNVESILQTAVQELGRALNASGGTIRLKLPDDEI